MLLNTFYGLAPLLQGAATFGRKISFFYETRREPLGICAGIGAGNYPNSNW